MQDVRQDRAPGTQLSGVVVVLLDEQVPPGTDETLFEHARRFGLDQLVEVLLAVREPPSERLVTSVPVDDLLEAERARVDGPYPPLRSLTRYWRVDVETAGVAVEEALRLLRDVRGVALAYGELVYSPRPFDELTAADVDAALGEYASRDRRFGGLSPS